MLLYGITPVLFTAGKFLDRAFPLLLSFHTWPSAPAHPGRLSVRPTVVQPSGHHSGYCGRVGPTPHLLRISPCQHPSLHTGRSLSQLLHSQSLLQQKVSSPLKQLLCLPRTKTFCLILPQSTHPAMSGISVATPPSAIFTVTLSLLFSISRCDTSFSTWPFSLSKSSTSVSLARPCLCPDQRSSS